MRSPIQGKNGVPKGPKSDTKYVEVPGYPDLKLNRDSGVYYVRKRIPGKPELFKSTKEKKVRAAQTIATEMIQAAIGRKPGLRSERIRISKCCDLLLDQCEEETRTKDEDGHVLRRMATYEKDLYYIPEIKKLFGEFFADQVDEQFLKSWHKRTGRKLGIKLGDHMKYLSKVLTYAFEEAYIGRKPRIKDPSKPPKKAANFSDELTVLFVKSATPILKDLTILGAENPLRPNEIDKLQWAFLTFAIDKATGEEITIYKLPEWFTKTRDAREITLSANANRILRERHRRRAKGSVYVFPSPKDPSRPISRQYRTKLWNEMKELARKRAAKKGIEFPTGRATFQVLRHNFYRKALLDRGLPLAAVSMAGGTSMKTLQNSYLSGQAHQTRLVTQAVQLKLENEE
jgi:integrase